MFIALLRGVAYSKAQKFARLRISKGIRPVKQIVHSMLKSSQMELANLIVSMLRLSSFG